MFDVILSNTLKRLDFAKELFDASYNAEEYFELWTIEYISTSILNPKRLLGSNQGPLADRAHLGLST